MKIIPASYEILTPIDYPASLRHIERVGRTCYKSEDRITEDSAEAFVRMLISRGHEAMIEHAGLSVRFIVDRGVSHELVRHRIASFAQESTRYCNYSKDKFDGELTFIDPSPVFGCRNAWENACEDAERVYLDLLEMGGNTPRSPCSAPEQPQDRGGHDSQSERVAALLPAALRPCCAPTDARSDCATAGRAGGADARFL